MMGPGERNPLPPARIQIAPCYSCHGSCTATTPPYHNDYILLPQNGYSYWDLRQLCLSWLMATAMMQQSRSAQGHYSYSRSRHSCCHSTYSSCCCLPSLLVQLLPASELWAIAAILQLSMFLPAQQLQLFLLTFIASMATLQQSFCMIVATSTTLLVLPPCQHPHPRQHAIICLCSCCINALSSYYPQLSSASNLEFIFVS